METQKFVIAREFTYGWDYTEHDENENTILYDTKEEADRALAEYIKDVNEAFENGDLSEPYQNDCKVTAFPLNS